MDIYRNYYINIVINGEQVEIVYSYLTYLTGWSYRYYCPIPGCIHHILSCVTQSDVRKGASKDNTSKTFGQKKEDTSNDANVQSLPINDSKCKDSRKHFPHITALKQHYSKVNTLISRL